MISLLLPRWRRPLMLESVVKRFDELQVELEKRVERLEGTKAQLVSHANGALSGHAHAGAPLGEIVNKEGT